MESGRRPGCGELVLKIGDSLIGHLGGSAISDHVSGTSGARATSGHQLPAFGISNPWAALGARY
jgi:hypothetical protein